MIDCPICDTSLKLEELFLWEGKVSCEQCKKEFTLTLKEAEE